MPLLAWIIRLWTTSQIALTIDATSLSDQFVVLAICVVYRGCAIPVAWTILPAGQKRAWRREWLRMLRQLRPAILSFQQTMDRVRRAKAAAGEAAARTDVPAVVLPYKKRSVARTVPTKASPGRYAGGRGA